MWGIRAIRVGVLLGGLAACVAASGCQTCCPCLWGEKTSTTTSSEKTTATDDKDAEKVLKDWKRGGWFEDQPTHLTPERVYGGIY